MRIDQIMIATKTATRDMSVREFVIECTRANTPGLPFTTPSGRISGRVTLKNVIKKSCLPDYIVETARILGDQLNCLDYIEGKTKEMMDSTVESFVQEPHLTIKSDAAALKALAMMEQNDTSYIFVMDDGHYRGVATIQSLARKLASIDQNNH
jgi:CBS-domain-containing membrane protein